MLRVRELEGQDPRDVRWGERFSMENRMENNCLNGTISIIRKSTMMEIIA